MTKFIEIITEVEIKLIPISSILEITGDKNKILIELISGKLIKIKDKEGELTNSIRWFIEDRNEIKFTINAGIKLMQNKNSKNNLMN